jgi:ABC-type polysaccharide/polyol phosphate export permease
LTEKGACSRQGASEAGHVRPEMTMIPTVVGNDLAAPNANSDRRSTSGARDLYAGLANWQLWSMLGWNDIHQRYRRSALGPFWITISMAIFIVLLGFIYSKLFHQDIAVYLPYVAMGLITWGFISGTTVEACSAFIENAGIIKQIRLPYSIYVMRMIWRSFIVFLHTVILIVPIAIFFRMDVGWSALLALPGMLLVVLNQIWLSIVIGVVATRFRDTVQLVTTAIQILMFITPIMWPVSAIADAHFVAEVNPFFHMIQLVRAPLLGEVAEPLSWIVVLGMCVVGYALAAFALARAHPRLVYWL